MKSTETIPDLPIYIGGGKAQESIEKDDLFFECKDDGKSWYRKIIKNKRHTYSQDLSGEPVYYGAKITGKWLHEDDFAVKFINPHKHKVHIVDFSKGYGINYIKDTFVPGKGWNSNPYDKKEEEKSLLAKKNPGMEDDEDGCAQTQTQKL